ncbi:MAG: polymerase subunit beta [Bacteroidota bacterium]|jgi:DNA polymerase-3 subunit beta
MKFIVSSSALSKQLAAIGGVIVNNPVVPILENFLFEINGKRLTVTASDLQTSMTTELVVEAHEDASIAIPARILLETLKNLPEQPVTFSINEGTYSVEISSDNGRYRLAGENATDFPQLRLAQKGVSVDMDAKVLKKAINQAIVATSNDELKPAMNGIYMDFSEDSATFVATDGHRMVRYIRSDVGVATQQPFIVPHKTLTLLNSLLSHEHQTVNITFNDSHVYFKLANVSMVSRLIDERYPDYANVIPANNTNKLTINRVSFLSSLRRISIYSNRTTHQIKLSIAGSELHILAEDFDFSNEANERLTCEYEGDDLEIGFNAKFLIEMLSNLSSEEVEMHFSGPSKAGLIFPKEKDADEDILLLIMPVILK